MFFLRSLALTLKGNFNKVIPLPKVRTASLIPGHSRLVPSNITFPKDPPFRTIYLFIPPIFTFFSFFFFIYIKFIFHLYHFFFPSLLLDRFLPFYLFFKKVKQAIYYREEEKKCIFIVLEIHIFFLKPTFNSISLNKGSVWLTRSFVCWRASNGDWRLGIYITQWEKKKKFSAVGKRGCLLWQRLYQGLSIGFLPYMFDSLVLEFLIEFSKDAIFLFIYRSVEIGD